LWNCKQIGTMSSKLITESSLNFGRKKISYSFASSLKSKQNFFQVNIEGKPTKVIYYYWKWFDEASRSCKNISHLNNYIWQTMPKVKGPKHVFQMGVEIIFLVECFWKCFYFLFPGLESNFPPKWNKQNCTTSIDPFIFA
jgi:hypothetical protein